MLIKMVSQLSGQEHTFDIDITPEQWNDYKNGPRVPIQRAFPNLSPDHREFLMTGITPEEWAETFPTDDVCAGEDEDEIPTGN